MVPADSHKASPTPWYSGYCYQQYIYTYRTITCYGASFQKLQFEYCIMLQSYNPPMAITIEVWAIPFSLATTRGITIVFFSSRYLDVSVPWVFFLITQDFTPSV